MYKHEHEHDYQSISTHYDAYENALGLRRQEGSHLKLLKSAGDLINCTDLSDGESNRERNEEGDDESLMAIAGSIYDEYDDFYAEVESNEAPIRLIKSLPHIEPYSFLGNRVIKPTDGYDSSIVD